ncbi:cadmium-translocating P-type ATPase [Lysobacter sp. KIS68-7]|uniref:heavy metal translocating P-type ATPase n=1 Tax=Lysobacter sp. KIS68-7 TaxID=2904252 RepID=UPI001E4F2585|nr:heavy metal translocating P-type ATPase [Lysobacter sp. KIS68-7]UHQ20062.1 cadmium-translocating P-type ATPase [Lysobacter sp. KIS68-7]
MNTVAASVAQAPSIEATCFHCSEPLAPHAPRVAIDGVERGFCCDGCAAAAQWIRDARLSDYYKLRSGHAGRVEPAGEALACWDREDILAAHARNVPGGREMVLLTDGMRCAACAWLIDRALMREPGVIEVSANAVTGRIRIAWDPARTPLSRPLRRLMSLGYRPWLATGAERERARITERNRALLRLGIAGLGAVQAMMFTEALYLDTNATMSIPMRDFLRWIAFLISSPVVFYSGWPFIAGCLRELRERRLGADTLVATSTLLAYGASLFETLTGGPHVWYDAAVMFVFLLLTARMLEQRARSAASARVDALARARPAFAVREREDGSREAIPLEALEAGDVACVAAGDAVPADGTLLADEAWFEESLLTGESRPVHKKAGDPVFAGTACREVPARMRVGAIGAATRLSQLAALVERAQAHRPTIARTADRVAMGFVAALLVVAAIVYFTWRAHAPDRALDVTLALLVISCPCALSLAIPAALTAANGSLARMGVLPVGADALERLARVTDVVFDKTGTLGDATPSLVDVATFDDMEREHALRIAAALERDSRHPLAAMFAPFAHEGLRATEVRSVAGQGVRGVVDGREWCLGHARFAAGATDDGALWLGDGAHARARFEVREAPRIDAAQALASLRAQGLSLHLCSGDGEAAVARFASTLDLPDAHARQTPEDKLARVRSLQAEGRVVAMVGDGLNDAPVLAGADVSIAVGDGAALAQRAADLVLATPALHRIPDAIALARRTRRIVRQNLAWAVGWNLLALPIAAMGLVTPWIAALGMALSSLTVTLNALRLARVREGVAA